VFLPVYPNWPSPSAELLRFDGGTTEYNKFMRLFRKYNSMFVLTSLGVNVDHSVNVGCDPYLSRYVELFVMKNLATKQIRKIKPSTMRKTIMKHRLHLQHGNNTGAACAAPQTS
jgi:hypothetical protein